MCQFAPGTGSLISLGLQLLESHLGEHQPPRPQPQLQTTGQQAPPAATTDAGDRRKGAPRVGDNGDVVKQVPTLLCSIEALMDYVFNHQLLERLIDAAVNKGALTLRAKFEGTVHARECSLSLTNDVVKLFSLFIL